MGKSSTLIKIAFFSLLIVELIVIQYNWLQSVYTDKEQALKSRAVPAIRYVAEGTAVKGPLQNLTDTAFTTMLRESFFSHELGHISFEFWIYSPDGQLATRGFDQKLMNDPDNLTLAYQLPAGQAKFNTDEHLIVVK